MPEQHLVYLCGPITGHDDDFAWREQAAVALARAGVGVLDPLRGKDKGSIGGEGLSYNGSLCTTDFARRDFDDVARSSLVLANVNRIPERRPCFGTPWEMGWAQVRGLPILLVSPYPCVRDHLFVRAFCQLVTENLDEAISEAVEILRGLPPGQRVGFCGYKGNI